jgi:hypothetical protein
VDWAWGLTIDITNGFGISQTEHILGDNFLPFSLILSFGCFFLLPLFLSLLTFLVLIASHSTMPFLNPRALF